MGGNQGLPALLQSKYSQSWMFSLGSFRVSERLVAPKVHPTPLGCFLTSCTNQVLAVVPGEICLGKQDASLLQAPLMALFSHWGYGK